MEGDHDDNQLLSDGIRDRLVLNDDPQVLTNNVQRSDQAIEEDIDLAVLNETRPVRYDRIVAINEHMARFNDNANVPNANRQPGQWFTAEDIIDIYRQEPVELPNGEITTPGGLVLPLGEEYYFDGLINQYIDVFELLAVADRRGVARANQLENTEERVATLDAIFARAEVRAARGQVFDYELWEPYNYRCGY